MQYPTILLLVSSVVIAKSATAPDSSLAAANAMQKCMKENSSIDLTVVLNQYLTGETLNDHNVDCFTACLLGELHFFNDDGSLNMNKMLDQIPRYIPNRQLIIDALKSCDDMKQNDKCDTAHLLIQCATKKQVPSLFWEHKRI